MSDALDRLRAAIGLMQDGKAREATQALESICATPPSSVTQWYVQGVAHHLLGRLERALTAFDRVLQALPDDADALNARAAVLQALGRASEAEAHYERALSNAPGNTQVLVNLAIVLEDQSRYEEALHRYDEAIAIDDSNRPALLNKSALLLRLGRSAEALDSARRLAAAHSTNADAHVNLAEALLALDRYDEAKDAAERALALAPTVIAAQIVRAVALACLGWFAESAAAFHLARATDPHTFAARMRFVWAQGDPARVNWPRGTEALPDPRVLYLARGAVRLARCDWMDRDPYVARLHQIVRDGMRHGNPVCDWILPFASNWLPLDEDVRYALAEAVGEAIEGQAAASRLPRPRAAWQRRRRLRLGYLTPDVRDHPNVSLTAPVIARHDRNRFEVHAYALNPRSDDPMAAHFRASCDLVHECHGSDDMKIARRIRADGIDILVDLAGYTDMARPEIAAFRPAAINCSYLGHPGSSGGRWIDYRISDPISTPASTQRWWSEQLALLPRTMFAYEPLDTSDSTPSRISEGLPEKGVVFCCFHTATKIDPAVFSVWLRLLHRIPGSVLWLTGNDSAAPHLRAAAAAQGIDPQRLVFARRHARKADHIGRQRLADLYLDTPAYNAHTTAVEALLAGLPVLTSPGNGPASRVAASILHAARLDSLITADLTAYEARAHALAVSPEALSGLRADWEKRRSTSALFDPKGLAVDIERCYEHMWERHVRGLPPLAFQLDFRSQS